ncbi:hypothetical protein [Gordonia shandongensis]|uniref:hypothetical protein n=1 Tax=Gordonia shandongensis TaxID=376351 RepID=UPI00040A4CFC|nr:hypothetical protein [Gordonia shandongensis]
MSALNLTTDVMMVLADEDPKGPEFGKASPLGLLVILVLLVAVFLLIRSMNKRLRKLPESFDTQNPEPDQAFDDGTDRVDEAVSGENAAPTADGSESGRGPSDDGAGDANDGGQRDERPADGGPLGRE